jgi:hypothetical protein
MALELQRVDPWNGESSSGTTYYGYATAGTQDTDPLWSIKKRSVVGGVLTYQYPYISGTTLANTYPAIQVDNVTYLQLSGLVWSNRTGYTYK